MHVNICKPTHKKVVRQTTRLRKLNLGGDVRSPAVTASTLEIRTDISCLIVKITPCLGQQCTFLALVCGVFCRSNCNTFFNNN